jgi:hypothetical protein
MFICIYFLYRVGCTVLLLVLVVVARDQDASWIRCTVVLVDRELPVVVVVVILVVVVVVNAIRDSAKMTYRDTIEALVPVLDYLTKPTSQNTSSAHKTRTRQTRNEFDQFT